MELVILSLLHRQGDVSIIQIGANDGKVADPLHGIASEYAARTRLLLIEPQPYLLPFLKDAYSAHPNATVANVAVGKAGSMTLFAVDPVCWVDCKPTRGWPVYRAPSGITSANRRHVESWLQRNYVGSRDLAEVVVELTVPSLPLLDVIEESGFGRQVDILQIDVEGFDDAVIYHSALEILKPLAVNFEHEHLSDESQENLFDYLQGLGYDLVVGAADTLAIRRPFRRRPDDTQ